MDGVEQDKDMTGHLKQTTLITQLGAFNIFHEFHAFQLTIFRWSQPLTSLVKLKDRSEAKLSLRHRKDASPWGNWRATMMGCASAKGLPVEIWNTVYVCFPNLGRKVRLNTQAATWKSLHCPLVHNIAVRSLPKPQGILLYHWIFCLLHDLLKDFMWIDGTHGGGGGFPPGCRDLLRKDPCGQRRPGWIVEAVTGWSWLSLL